MSEPVNVFEAFKQLEAQDEQDFSQRFLGALEALADNHRAFLLNYLSNGHKPKQAALDAGFEVTTASNASVCLLGRADVQAAKSIWLEAMTMSVVEIKHGLSEIANASLADFLKPTEDGDDFQFDLSGDDIEAKMRCIRSIRFNKDGELAEISLYDRKSALDSLARIHGLFKDNLTVNDRAADPRAKKARELASELSDEEIAREIEDYLE